MTQKYFHGQRVKVDAKTPAHMRHFESGFEGIVDYSYTDRYGGKAGDGPCYSLLVLDNNDTPVNRISWYYETQLTLLSDDRAAGEKLFQQYKELHPEAMV